MDNNIDALPIYGSLGIWAVQFTAITITLTK